LKYQISNTEIIAQRLLPANLDSIDYADDGGVYRAVLTAKGHASGTSLDDQDGLLRSRTHGINRDDVAFFVLTVDAHEPRYEELAPMKPLVFARRNYGSDNTS
jgi:hypothetical protein